MGSLYLHEAGDAEEAAVAVVFQIHSNLRAGLQVGAHLSKRSCCGYHRQLCCIQCLQAPGADCSSKVVACSWLLV